MIIFFFQSHKSSEGHWDGSCGHQHAARLLKDMIYMDNITDGMQQLGTTDTGDSNS